MAKPAYQTQAWRRLCARAWLVYGRVCWWCGAPIDRNLPPTDRLSGVIDHLIPPSVAGPTVRASTGSDPATGPATQHAATTITAVTEQAANQVG
jgi:hypothetical protein